MKAGPVYISSSCFSFRGLAELLNDCEKNNFYNIELGCSFNYHRNYFSILKKYPKFNFLIHNYFPPPKDSFVLNLSSANREILKKSINQCKKAMDLCAEFGVPFFSVHAGFLADLKPGDLGANKKIDISQYIDRESGLSIFKNSIEILLAYGSRREVGLLIENNVVNKANLVNGKNESCLMVEKEEILTCMELFDSRYLGLLVDVGHLNVTANLLNFNRFDFLKDLGRYIRAFHLSANNGIQDQHLPFGKNEWFLPILQQEEFKKIPKILEFNKSVLTVEILNCMKMIKV